MENFCLKKIENWALLAFVFFLPLLEAPKNIALGIYVFSVVLNCFYTRDWGGGWSKWDSIALAFIIGALLSSTYGAHPSLKGFAAAGDIVSYSTLFFIVRRRNFEAEFYKKLFFSIVVGVLIGLLHGYWALFVTKSNPALMLNSVGHVNHSAIYLSIVMVSALIWAELQHKLSKYFFISSALFIFMSLVVTQARGAIIPSMIFICFWKVHRQRTVHLAIRSIVVLLAVFAVTLMSIPGAVDKTLGGLKTGEIASYRPALGRVAILAVREYPWLGVGINNFRAITPATADEWQRRSGQIFSEDSLHFLSHAHSLYFTTMAERGLFGLMPLLIFLIFLAKYFWVDFRRFEKNQLQHGFWGMALGVWIITVVGGIFNTTLHHEHAMISMLIFSIWLGNREKILKKTWATI